MKTYTLSMADSMKHTPKHPERTARRMKGAESFDFVYQVWPNRSSLIRAMQKQDKDGHNSYHWVPCKAEG